jgi:hypothetical protein
MDTPPKPPRPAFVTKVTEQPQNEVQTITPDRTAAPAAPAEQRVLSAIPGVTESKMFFEYFIFYPDESIPKADLIEVLRAAKLTFSTEKFVEFPEHVKRHFLRFDRTGATERYRTPRSK